ncbi:rhamnan synthesis F family protein [Mesorhizobium sp. CA15]|uniref:rhamnan synthesis F family protein n=1 Tax=Mesorhizobium sp. CA15 TaxID=2876641 RepID=UPI001CD077A7|nr:rhamnan synthesis F family protein [Mesorhizobium sp. CA15]MBZ9865448.1 rhamnan synthesis F family protein [Mesorhizobium sp. CA15]
MTNKNVADRLKEAAIKVLARSIFYYPKVFSAVIRRLFGKDGFITESIEGNRRFENGKFAIFLIWQPKELSWYVKNALDALAEAEVNLIVVANHTLNDATRAALISQSRWILTRDNTGFDIGGFQDATHFLRKHFDVERLIYLNDSVYFFREGLTEMIQRLATSKADICTAFENWEFFYHIQSFCFSVSRRMLDTPAAVEFWRKYLPVNSRRWAIQRGEIGLSKAIVPFADEIDVIYSPNEIQPFMKDLSLGELISLSGSLPSAIRLRREDHKGARGNEVQGDILNRISGRSQIHTGGFLYRRFLRCPLLKRDLVYRLQYSIYDVEACLRDLGHEGHLHEILSDMRRKGAGTQLSFLKRIQFNDGII